MHKTFLVENGKPVILISASPRWHLSDDFRQRYAFQKLSMLLPGRVLGPIAFHIFFCRRRRVVTSCSFYLALQSFHECFGLSGVPSTGGGIVDMISFFVIHDNAGRGSVPVIVFSVRIGFRVPPCQTSADEASSYQTRARGVHEHYIVAIEVEHSNCCVWCAAAFQISVALNIKRKAVGSGIRPCSRSRVPRSYRNPFSCR